MKKYILKNKVFLVTGSGSGIGFETVKLLLINGSVVFGMIRKLSPSLNILKRQFGENLFLFTGDVSKPRDCEKFVQYAKKKQKKIHGLIHCAGIGIRSPAKDIKHDIFRKIMETDFSSMVYLYGAARDEIEKTGGYMVAVSSIQGLMTLPFRSVYAAAKHALNAYINCVRLEEKNIHFLIVNFGYVNTRFSVNALRGNGEKYSIADARQQKGMSAQRAAQLIINAMIKRKKRIIPAGFKEKFALRLQQWVPGLYDKLIVRHVKPE